MSDLREALARRWGWVRRGEPRPDKPDRTDDRRRFWSDYREGQRQAEESSSGKAPRKT